MSISGERIFLLCSSKVETFLVFKATLADACSFFFEESLLLLNGIVFYLSRFDGLCSSIRKLFDFDSFLKTNEYAAEIESLT